MDKLKLIIDACMSILSYPMNLLGYSVSLVNVVIWACLASFCLWLLRRLFS